MNYTKGPWGFVWQKGEYLIDAPMITDIGIKIICSVTTRSAQEESKANAHLISAAPELLEALKNLMGLWDREDVADTWNDEFMKAQTAISKAEGKD